jgi:ABC-type lipoprotein release transport system permease subunit
MARTAEALFSWREGLALALLAGALLAFVILAFDKASGLSAEEKREIGILKAIGWETSDVMTLKLWEGGLISGFAFLLGVTTAWAHVFFFSAGLFEPVLKGWSTLYPRLALVPSIDALELATLGVLTIVPYIAAILVPVWRTASTDPDAVMR